MVADNAEIQHLVALFDRMITALRVLGVCLSLAAGPGFLAGCSASSRIASAPAVPASKPPESLDLTLSCLDRQGAARPLAECFHDPGGDPGYATVLDQGIWHDIAVSNLTDAAPQSTSHSIPLSVGMSFRIDVATGGNIDRSLALDFRLHSTQVALESRSVPGGNFRLVIERFHLSARTLTLLGRPDDARLATALLSERGVKNPERLPPVRTLEEIQGIFDRNKSSFYELFSRRLRQKPDLRGKVIVAFTIAPGGEITRCDLISSELNDPELERTIVGRIQQLRFRPRRVPEFTYNNYPIVFIPT